MLAFAIALVRAWTSLYTGRLNPILRDARRAEIESDLWEWQEDARQWCTSANHLAIHMVARVLSGMPDDLVWRLEQAGDGREPFRRAVWAAVTGAGLVAVAFGVIVVLFTTNPPPPPPAPARVPRQYRAPPPPPPPPPPPRLDSRGHIIPAK